MLTDEPDTGHVIASAASRDQQEGIRFALQTPEEAENYLPQTIVNVTISPAVDPNMVIPTAEGGNA